MINFSKKSAFLTQRKLMQISNELGCMVVGKFQRPLWDGTRSLLIWSYFSLGQAYCTFDMCIHIEYNVVKKAQSYLSLV